MTTIAPHGDHYCSVRRAVVLGVRSYIPWYSVLYCSEV